MELKQYLAVIRKYLWLMALTALIGGGVAYYVSSTTPPVYRATTTLEIKRAQSDPLSDPFATSNARTAENVANVFAAKIQSSVFLEDVRRRLNLETSLKDMLSVAQVGDTQFLRISAESNEPTLSRALADTAAQVFIEREEEQQQARFRESLEDLNERIEALEASIAETQTELATLGAPEESTSEFVKLERARLESQLSRDQTRLVVLLNSVEEFRMAMARYTDYISVYAPAEVSKIGVSIVQNTALGAVTGLMIGVGIAFLLEYLDERGLALPLLGALPGGNNGETREGAVVADHPLAPISEAFRNLRASIRFATLDEPAQTLLVTSPLPTEGKSFTATNLAATLALGGATVTLLDLDLRHPTVHRFLDIDQEPGVTDALLDKVSREQIVARVENVEGLRVIPVGQHAHNPAEILTSRTFQEFLAWLETVSDVVVIDSPPVLPVADAVMLAGQVDRVLLVLENGETHRSAAVQAVERLTSAGGKILGAVLNQIDQRVNGYYSYYYYYPQKGQNGRGRGLGRWLPFAQSKKRERHS
jgi:capsular exopolysaccharide synthesis family protein